LKGASGTAAGAKNVKVFFRVFTTQTFDTDFINSATVVTSADPNVTFSVQRSDLLNPLSRYRGTDGGGAVKRLLAAVLLATGTSIILPATTIPPEPTTKTSPFPRGLCLGVLWVFSQRERRHDEFWGCGERVWPPPGPTLARGSAHNCLVAQIAYQDAPIETPAG